MATINVREIVLNELATYDPEPFQPDESVEDFIDRGFIDDVLNDSEPVFRNIIAEFLHSKEGTALVSDYFNGKIVI